MIESKKKDSLILQKYCTYIDICIYILNKVRLIPTKHVTSWERSHYGIFFHYNVLYIHCFFVGRLMNVKLTLSMYCYQEGILILFVYHDE